MQVTVEGPLCIGSGSCEMFAPDVFAVGEDGVAHVIATSIEGPLVEAVNKAAASCPTQAIIVSD